jgi:DnaJ-domain-containing protein 1
MVQVYKDEERRLEMLSMAGLIQRFNEGCPSAEVYRKGIRCYQVLLNVIENPEFSEKVSELAKIPAGTIKSTALKIVNVLLFNRDKNPFLSLGLPSDAADDEIKKRWKKLLMLYHPDRAFNRKAYEEIAKKINQAYEEIGELKEKGMYREEAIKEQRKSVRNITRLPRSSFPAAQIKYLKYFPAIILVAVICIAIFSITLYVIYKIN